MRFAARFGTPNELDVKTHDLASQSKNHLLNKMSDRMEWAGRYNLEVSRRIGAAREELSNLDVGKLPIGDRRRWSAEDDVSGVIFVYEIERIE